MSKLEIVREEGEPCRFCQRKTLDEFKYGHMYKIQGITVHYYCVLFSQRIEQNGADEEGVLGFLFEDIMNELNKVKNTKCSYCLQTNASVHCAISKCKLVFHFPCGLQRGSLHQFKDHYKSYCFSHRPKQKIPAAVLTEAEKNTPVCSICFDSVDYKNILETIWAPCCIKTWYHRTCLQKFSLSSGYFFRCPICNQKGIFLKWVKTHGIRVPDQDASWEMEINAFRDLEYRHDKCDATHCKNSDRTVNIKDTPWELILCNSCASEGVHMICANLKSPDSSWECRSCKNIRPYRGERIPERRSCRNQKRISDLQQEKNLDAQIYGESSSNKGLKRKNENADELDKMTAKKMKNVEDAKDKQKKTRKSAASSKKEERAAASKSSCESCNSNSDLKGNDLEGISKDMEAIENIQNLEELPKEEILETENLSSSSNIDLETRENIEVASPFSSSNKNVETSGEIFTNTEYSSNIENKRLLVSDESSDSDVELLFEEKKEKLVFKKKGKASDPCCPTQDESVAKTGPSGPENDEFEVIVLHCREENKKTRESEMAKSPENNTGLTESIADSNVTKESCSKHQSGSKQNVKKERFTERTAASSSKEKRDVRKRRSGLLVGSDKKIRSKCSACVTPDISKKKVQLTLKCSNVSKDDNFNIPCSSENVVSSTKQSCNRKHKKKSHKKVSNLKPETLQRDMNLLNEELKAFFELYYERSREKKKGNKSKSRKSSKKDDVSSPQKVLPAQSFVKENVETVEQNKPNKEVEDGNTEVSETTKLDVAGSDSNVCANEDEIIEID